VAESNEKKTVAERAADLSEDVLESVRDRQQTVIEAMRKFVDRLDDAMPSLVDPSVRKKVVDAIGDYYEQLATTTNEFVARMVRSASGTLKESAPLGNPHALASRKYGSGRAA
jgi:DNA-binding PucR family transcriptional regulator